MAVDGALLASQTRLVEFSDYVRVIPSKHASTPLGCTAGHSRFGGTGKTFAVLYAAHSLTTALAEAVVRDRFEGLADRRLFAAELTRRSAVRLRFAEPLRLVDLRKGGCLKLGISTDIAGAKCFDEAQAFSSEVYGNEAIDGILYASRLTSENCVAIFDRAISRLASDDISPLVQLQDLGSSLAELNVALIG
jgi:hypothetical protein